MKLIKSSPKTDDFDSLSIVFKNLPLNELTSLEVAMVVPLVFIHESAFSVQLMLEAFPTEDICLCSYFARGGLSIDEYSLKALALEGEGAIAIGQTVDEAPRVDCSVLELHLRLSLPHVPFF